ncbi:hypothetical protein NECAME_09974 [Necator americanus]|uniref:ERAP1-like C-terminal domain-containing protein n=1 Tax=Necator americanus TaxID=51031 RepID=W2TBD4_NECAM|nr:hypothetical protein NECAME_09974 [Necator americanus]ETN79168.1 hypothetical protein NECAME_09974 [Necator americanus]
MVVDRTEAASFMRQNMIIVASLRTSDPYKAVRIKITTKEMKIAKFPKDELSVDIARAMRNDQLPNSLPVSRRDEAFDPETAFTSNTYKKHVPGHKHSGVQWKIPLFLRDPLTLEPTVKWLVENSTAILDLGKDTVLDREGRSFVRIRYDAELYLDITARLHADPNCIPVAARTRLMDDSFTLAEVGNLSYAHALNISVYLRKETAYPPVKMLHAHLDFLVSRLTAHPKFPLFQKFIIAILEPLFEHFQRHPLENDVKIHEE